MKQVIAHTFAWCLLTVAFLAPSNQAQAQDVAAEFIGSFQGQLEAVTGETYLPFGRIEFTVAKTGKASGKITLLGSKAYPFTATLGADGETKISANVDVVKAKIGPSPLTLNLSVANDGTFTAGGIPLSPVVPASVGIYRVVAGSATKVAVFGKTNVCDWQGTYSLAFADPTAPGGDSRAIPSGASYASATVSSAGILTVKGKLADGSALTASVKPTTTGKYSFQASPYKTGGGFATSFELTKTGEATSYSVAEAATNVATWSKTAAPKDKIYAEGFGPLKLAVVMHKWTVPDAKAKQTLAQLLGIEDSVDEAVRKFQFDFDISGGGLDLAGTKYDGMIPAKLTIDAKNALVPVFGDVFAPIDAKEWAKIWTGKVDPKTGIFQGTLTLTELVGGGTNFDSAGLENMNPKTRSALPPIKYVKRKVTIQGVLMNVDDPEVPLAFGFSIVPPVNAKTEKTQFGAVELGGQFQLLNTGAPDLSGVRPGTAGTYEVQLNAIIKEIDYSALAAGDSGFEIKSVGSLKNLPSTVGKTVFSVSPDLSTVVFNGRKLPLIGDQRQFNVALVYSDAKSTNIRDTLTVILYLDLVTGQVKHVGAQYVQILNASIKLPKDVPYVGGKTINGLVPQVAWYNNSVDAVKTH